MERPSATDFAEYFAQLHGYPPFPWQERLAHEVVRTKEWPDVLAVPTGAGKTSALDVALFALACDPDAHPRRILLVVDRRVVVDQGAVHARGVLGRLAAATGGLLHRTASSLRALWGGEGDEPPFEVAVLRGGMPRDDTWARRPDRPAVALSTVDQVGSRLLFRGYGVSDSMAPIHAGLLGHDTLFLLDEVHLSVPFAETLLAIRDRWREFHGADLPSRWGVVRMSATPGLSSPGESVFHLRDEDRTHAALGRRLAASKSALLDVVPVAGKEPDRKKKLAARCADEAAALVEGGAKAVGVVVNRVDTARLAARLLAEKKKRTFDVVLLTGRMRPLDRDRILDQSLLGRIGLRRRHEAERPLVLVATQCVEAGADFDLDGLVTEVASLDALRQRFGRVDRRGELGESRSVILARSDQVDAGTVDPVYGPALAATFAWLRGMCDAVDLGIEAFPAPPDERIEPLLAPRPHAPVLLPAHLDAWAQTSPRPWPEPQPDPWLHGPDRGAPEVVLVWRADIDEAALAAAVTDDAALAGLSALLSAAPPSALEALSLPLHAAQRWLAGGEAAEVADVVGAAAEEAEVEGGRLALRWAGDDSVVVSAPELAPGDTLVVPSAYGGLSLGSWDPAATDPVSDLGDLAQWRHRRRATLRLDERVVPCTLGPAHASALPRVPDEDDHDASPAAEVAAWLAALPADLGEPWADIVDALGRSPRRIALPGARWALVGRPPSRKRRAASEVTSEDDSASFGERVVGLDEHCAEVGALAARFAANLGLPGVLCEDLRLAGTLHDVGKADVRFQRMLLGGSEVRLALLGAPIAKSAIPARDAAARETSRLRSGYPRGYRHEVLSSALLGGARHRPPTPAGDNALRPAHDKDLVLHLVEAHHGRCRPFAPPVPDENTVEVEVAAGGAVLRASTDHGLAHVSSGVADRFWLLVDRYGWWGLAWLEALLRLADHRASEREQEGTR
jgi:CRISPR-associated endonuclease/helicase Cas3